MPKFKEKNILKGILGGSISCYLLLSITILMINLIPGGYKFWYGEYSSFAIITLVILLPIAASIFFAYTIMRGSPYLIILSSFVLGLDLVFQLTIIGLTFATIHNYYY